MKSKVLIAGASGMVGRALVNELEKNKNIKLLKPTRDEVNYLNYIEVENYFKKNKPDYVYIVAAKVGGILANAENKIDFFASPFDKESVNLLIKKKIKILKIASPEIRDYLLIEHIAKHRSVDSNISFCSEDACFPRMPG